MSEKRIYVEGGGDSKELQTRCREGFRKVPQGTIQAMTIERITLDPQVMGGKPCIRGMRVTVGTVVGLVAAGRTPDEILTAYPYLEAGDISAALTYAAWRSMEQEIVLSVSMPN